jgi:hypothetical protein
MPFLAQGSSSSVCPECCLSIDAGFAAVGIHLPLVITLLPRLYSLTRFISGQLTRPIQNPAAVPSTSGKSPALHWAHAACIGPDDPRVPICKHWRRQNRCLYKDRCQFRHPEIDCNAQPAVKQPHVVARHGARKHRRVYNEGRCGVVRRWMLRTFGEDFLRRGSGVLDIAGGKGEMAFELTNLNDVPCTVIDPRPMDLYRWCLSFKISRLHSY